jgi:hypothetical protein
MTASRSTDPSLKYLKGEFKMADKIDKKSEPQYQYDYTSGQVQGADSIPEALAEGGAPLVRDQLAPSLAKPKSAKMPPLDAPELPIPTPRGRERMAIKKEITEAAQKNVWISNPSYMGAFLAKFWDLLNTLRDTRFTEAQTDQMANKFLLELGRETANYAKELRDLASNKEFIRAMGSFASSAVSAVQIGATIGSKGKVLAEDKKSDLNTQIQTKKSELKDLDPATKNLTGNDANAPQAAQNLQAQTTPDDATKKQMTEKRKEIAELEGEQRRTIQDNIRMENESIRQRGELFNHVIQGCTGVVSALYEKQAGGVEKAKTINETLSQLFSKLDDGAKKAKDDLQSQIDRIIQQLVQTSSENTKSHLVSRG